MDGIYRKAVIAFGLLVYTMAIAELCVRILEPQPLIPRYVTGTPYGVRGNIAHAVYRHKTPEVDVEYRINGQGMRADHDFPFAKPPGTCRIAILGDSFLVGYELDLKETIAQRIEDGLRGRGYRAEVLNFAVSGFGTGEMLRTYERYATKFAPDVVIFQWHISDLNENLVSGLYELKDDRLVATNANYLPSMAVQDALMKFRVYRLVADHSQLYSWAREGLALVVKRSIIWLQRARAPTITTAATVTTTDKAAAETEAEERAKRYVGKLSGELLRYAAAEIAGDSRAFLVLEIPRSRNRTLFESSWNQMPDAIVAGLPVIHGNDILQPLALSDRMIFYEKGHGHLAPFGASALAGATVERLAMLPQLRECAAAGSSH